MSALLRAAKAGLTRSGYVAMSCDISAALAGAALALMIFFSI